MIGISSGSYWRGLRASDEKEGVSSAPTGVGGSITTCSIALPPPPLLLLRFDFDESEARPAAQRPPEEPSAPFRNRPRGDALMISCLWPRRLKLPEMGCSGFAMRLFARLEALLSPPRASTGAGGSTTIRSSNSSFTTTGGDKASAPLSSLPLDRRKEDDDGIVTTTFRFCFCCRCCDKARISSNILARW